jgi:hypothetical protein
VTAVFDELIATHPTSIAFAAPVVTPATTPDVLDAPVATLTAAPSGLALLTPE